MKSNPYHAKAMEALAAVVYERVGNTPVRVSWGAACPDCRMSPRRGQIAVKNSYAAQPGYDRHWDKCATCNGRGEIEVVRASDLYTILDRLLEDLQDSASRRWAQLSADDHPAPEVVKIDDRLVAEARGIEIAAEILRVSMEELSNDVEAWGFLDGSDGGQP